MKESYLYKKLNKQKIQCQTCPHQCLISLGQKGICGVRQNIKGKLYLLVYNQAIAAHIDPIEKKPLFHFLPGSQTFSLATVGCNFRCDNCQNWEISQAPKMKINQQKIRKMGFKLPAEIIIKKAKEKHCLSISYTYTEPTIFLEYALDIMKLAKKNGLKNNWISNGFISQKALNLILPYLDAVNIDLKSFSDNFYQKFCGGRLEPVLATLRKLKEKKVWLEITTLLIPTLTDDEKTLFSIASFIKNELGSKTPWHISAFSPEISWHLQHLPPTPIETIKKAWQIGTKAGLKYIYSGNITGLNYENTYCPKCGELVIQREGYLISRFDKKGKCPKCGEKINLILN